MNWKAIILKTTLLMIVGFMFIRLFSGNDFDLSLVPITLMLLLFALILFVVIIIKDIQLFKTSKSFLSFIPTLIGLFVTTVTIITINKINAPNTSRIVLHAGHDSGVGGCWLIFRQDSSYEYENGTPLGSHAINGKYSIQDSIIRLDHQSFDKALVSNKLVIRQSDNLGALLYQLDNSGQEIRNAIFFTINFDNRK